MEHVAGADEKGHLLVFWRSSRSNGWEVVDASDEAGRTVGTADLTCWTTSDGSFTVEHVGCTDSDGALLVFYWSARHGHWRVVDATAESGRAVHGGLTSWVTRSAEFTVEHVAGVNADGHLIVSWWSPRAGHWQAVDATVEAGQTAGVGPTTSWVTVDGEFTVEHVGCTTPTGRLLVFYWSRRRGHWSVVDATAESGRSVGGGLTSWVTRSGRFTVEHVAGVDTAGRMIVSWWSPRVGHWQALDATRIARGPALGESVRALPPGPPEIVIGLSKSGRLLLHWWSSRWNWQVAELTAAPNTVTVGALAVWSVPGSATPERVACIAADGRLLVYASGGAERELVETLRTPSFGLRRMRNVRQKVLLILWDPHKPDVPQPSRATVEAAVFGPTNSVRSYFLENSDGQYTIERANVVGWYDSDFSPVEYWPGGGQAGRDSGAEAIRKAARALTLETYDTDIDGRLEAEELAMLFVLPGRGDGGGLNRIVGEDYTTRETANGITVDGERVTWIAEVSIGSPPGPGIVAHELSHLLLGLGDMYFTFFTPSAAGPFSLMDQDGRAPHLDPVAKLKLGWLHPRLVTGPGRYQLRDVETRHEALALIDPDHGLAEYFLVENRWPGTSFDRVLPDRGLAIWHVMEDPQDYDAAPPPPNVTAGNWGTLGTGMGAWSRKGIRLIRPIQTNPTDNRRALWDGSDPLTGYDLLSTDPDAQHAQLRWGDGTPSGFAITSIPIAGPDVEVTVQMQAVPGQVIVPTVIGLRPSQAEARLRAAGLQPALSGPGGNNAWVASQSPRAGTEVAAGATVRLRLRTGPIP